MSRFPRRTSTAARIAIGAAALVIAATPAFAREAEPGDDRAPTAAAQVVSPPATAPAPATPAAARRHGADDGPGHVRHGRGRDDSRHTARRGRGRDDAGHHGRRGRGNDDAPGHVRHTGADDGPNHG